MYTLREAHHSFSSRAIFRPINGRTGLPILTAPTSHRHSFRNATMCDACAAHHVCVRCEHSGVMPATTRCTGIRSAHAETRCPKGDSSLRRRTRSVSHDKAILARARTEPRRCPVRLRVPPFANRTFDRSRLSPWVSTSECLLRYRLCSGPKTPSSNPPLTKPRLYLCSGSRFRGSNSRAKTTARAEPEPATDEASTTRIVASTILPRRSARFWNVTMGGNCTTRSPSL